MGKRASASFKFDKKANKFFAEIDKKMPLARQTAVDVMGIVWSDEAKLITQADNHIDTGAYVNSIGYDSEIPGKDGTIQKGKILYDLSEKTTETTLLVGSDVKYASPLEKRYNIMARALDSSQDEMIKQGTNAVKKIILGK